jgi:hypothetical protein
MIVLLYHALGNARISVRRRMSYLKEAEPISTIAKKKMKKINNKCYTIR